MNRASQISANSHGCRYSICQSKQCKNLAVTQIGVPMRYNIPEAAQGRISLCKSHAKHYITLSLVDKAKFPLKKHEKRVINV